MVMVQGYFLLVDNDCRQRISYDPNRGEYLVEGLHEGTWGIHCWGLRRVENFLQGTTVAYQEVQLKPGKNVVKF